MVRVMAVAVGAPIGYDGRRWPAGRRAGSLDGHSARSTWQEEAATDAITRAAVMRRDRAGRRTVCRRRPQVQRYILTTGLHCPPVEGRTLAGS